MGSTAADGTGRAGKRSHSTEPGVTWRVWSCCNNERACLLALYSVALVLTFALMGICAANGVFNTGIGFAPALFPPFDAVVSPISNCTPTGQLSSSVFTEKKSFGAGAAVIFTFSVLGMLGLFGAIAYAVIDLSGRITYYRMNSHWRLVLMSLATSLAVLYFTLSLLVSFGVIFYTDNQRRCYEAFKGLVTATEGDLVDLVAMDSQVLALQIGAVLSWVAFVCTVLCIVLYSSLVCTRRSWYETKTWSVRDVQLT